MKQVFCSLLLLVVFGFAVPRAAAHCDTLDGPVVTAAKHALQSADVTPVLKWVQPGHEAEIRDAFARTLKVRQQSEDARRLADRYFFETVVRVHRAGEGAPYTGLKPAGSEVEPGIALADKAVASGSADELVSRMTDEVAAGIRQRFDRVQGARKHAEHNVDAGRRYIAAYVDFIHYVEGMHATMAQPSSNSGLVQATETHLHRHK